MADVLQRHHRLVDLNPRCESRLDEAQHHGGGSELEVVGDLAQVRVADDHMEPAVLVRRGVRLVAGVDDGPPDGGFEANLGFEEVRALADLEAGARAVLANPHAARAADDLTRHEKRRQPADDVAERD
ncbi:hypothetical protein D9M69_609720 [compost metagenome]